MTNPMPSTSEKKNREIKFRAWNKPTSRMIYWPSLQEIMASGNMTYHDRRNFEAEHNEFMQFTGLLDRNGKEIYDGDILKYKNNITDQVEWKSIRGGWNIYPDKFSFQPAEVIGNIYENPDLTPQ